MEHKKEILKEWQVAENNWRRYERARDSGHLDYIDIAKKCDSFYRGEQWELADQQKLESEGRPALTINTVLSTINAVLGEQANNRGMVQFKPKRTGSEEVSTILQKVYQVIHDQNDMDHKESQVFADGLIQDRGYFEIGVDFNENIEGEIKISVEDPLDIYIDPDAKDYDPDTWNEVIKSRWLSLDEVEISYGEAKASKIRALVDSNSYYGPDSVHVIENRFGDTLDTLAPWGANSYELPESELRQIRRVRIIERQYKVPYLCEYFINPEFGDSVEVPQSWDEEKKREHETKYGLMRVEKETLKVRFTITADRVVLYDDWSIYPFFTIVPFFPYFRRGRPFGMVRNLISPQEQLNKISSQELHVVNTTANSGWIVETGSLSNMDVDDLEQRGAETGLVLEYHKGAQPPGKIPPNTIPAGLDRIGMKAAINIKEISGVSDAMLGYDSPEVSGVAIEAKQARGQVQIQVPLDHLNKTRMLLAKRVLKLIQEWYDNPRLFFMTEMGQETPEAIEINRQLPDGSRLYDVTVGDYDIDISVMPSRDVYIDSQFAEAMALRSANIAVPDDTVIEFSHLENKQQIAERIRQIQGLAEPTEEEQRVNAAVQQMQMEQIKLQMAQMEATINELQSKTALNMAKAQTELRTDETHEHAMHKLQTDIAMNTQDNQTQLAIAAMQAGQRADEKELESATRVETALIRNAEQEKREMSKERIELAKLGQQERLSKQQFQQPTR